MTLDAHAEYFLSSDRFETSTKVFGELADAITECLIERKSSMQLYADNGLLPLWQRLLLGSKRELRPYFYCAWQEERAILFFLDENGSEYRSYLDKASDNGTEEVLLVFEEPQTFRSKYILTKPQLVSAIEFFLDNGGNRPDWLSYDFVE